MDRLIQMIINTLLRQVINRGVKTGIDRLAGGGKPASQMTPEERQQSQGIARKARQAANLARRLGR
jgi:hypothetical protein